MGHVKVRKFIDIIICLMIYIILQTRFVRSALVRRVLGAVLGTRRQHIAFLVHLLAEEPVVGITVRVHAR